VFVRIMCVFYRDVGYLYLSGVSLFSNIDQATAES
jgi:hypothetical protein